MRGLSMEKKWVPGIELIEDDAGLGMIDPVTGAVYRQLQVNYTSRAAERAAHKRWKKKGWSDEEIAAFEERFCIRRVQ